MAVRMCLRRPRPLVWAAALGLAHIIISMPSAFVGCWNTHPGAHGRASIVARNFFTFPGAVSSEEANRVYGFYEAKYPVAAKRGSYLGNPVDQASVTSRFGELVNIFGKEDALLFAELEPILLAQSGTATKNSYEYLKSTEEPGSEDTALTVLRNNPRLLTVSATEFQRTKSSVSSLAGPASALAVLRPFGEVGISLAIFGGFIVFLVVARVALVGAGGYPSLISILFSPFLSLFGGFTVPAVPRPDEIAAEYGINLASIVLLFPLAAVARAALQRVSGGKGSPF